MRIMRFIIKLILTLLLIITQLFYAIPIIIYIFFFAKRNNLSKLMSIEDLNKLKSDEVVQMLVNPTMKEFAKYFVLMILIIYSIMLIIKLI